MARALRRQGWRLLLLPCLLGLRPCCCKPYLQRALCNVWSLSCRPHHFKHHHAKHEAKERAAEAKQQAMQRAEANSEAKRQREHAAEVWAEEATM